MNKVVLIGPLFSRRNNWMCASFNESVISCCQCCTEKWKISVQHQNMFFLSYLNSYHQTHSPPSTCFTKEATSEILSVSVTFGQCYFSKNSVLYTLFNIIFGSMCFVIIHYIYTSIQKRGISTVFQCFWKKSLMRTKAVFIIVILLF